MTGLLLQDFNKYFTFIGIKPSVSRVKEIIFYIFNYLSGSPADGQLSANDQLFSINGQIAYNLPQPQVISMIRYDHVLFHFPLSLVCFEQCCSKFARQGWVDTETFSIKTFEYA